ncbi:hypothetical protein P9A16_34490 [Shinella sp. 838]|uniref:hypothetical protein n=1 Tax=Shinella sp. 838 TaxID=3038164 RepID=UPI0024155AB7|nr:hypothetical protein [Shinella sp. 838]MDG4676195.1 hypothetical protein [Shinella sp. 838]
MASIVIASLNARLQPVHRGELEDTFNELMQRKSFGMRVVGGGTLQEKTGEISGCDLEVEVDELNEEAIQLAINTLESMLAPKGSRLHIPIQNRAIDFGKHEGLALYLNGTDLPPEVYATSDINSVIEECNRLLSRVAFVVSHWEGPSETALYIYGMDFNVMRRMIAPLLDSNPLCKKSRVERIA